MVVVVVAAEVVLVLVVVVGALFRKCVPPVMPQLGWNSGGYTDHIARANHDSIRPFGLLELLDLLQQRSALSLKAFGSVTPHGAPWQPMACHTVMQGSAEPSWNL